MLVIEHIRNVAAKTCSDLILVGVIPVMVMGCSPKNTGEDPTGTTDAVGTSTSTATSTSSSFTTATSSTGSVTPTTNEITTAPVSDSGTGLNTDPSSATSGSPTEMTGITTTACELPEGETTSSCELPPENGPCSCERSCPGGGVQCLTYDSNIDQCLDSPGKGPDGHVAECDLPCICAPIFQKINPECPQPDDCTEYPPEALAALECALNALRDRKMGKIKWTRTTTDLEEFERGTIYITDGGNAASQTCLKLPDSAQVDHAIHGSLKSAAFFEGCISDPLPSNRFGCLYNPFTQSEVMSECGCE